MGLQITGPIDIATSATNLLGGSAGTVPYQTATNTTGMLAAGTTGYFLKSNGAASPTWVEASMADMPDAWAKKSVKATTTANITLSGTQTIDGISVVAGDRVLVKNQTTASQNGIYIVSASTWSRSTDADTASKIAGACVNTDSGTVNGGYRFDTDFKTTDTLGTTSMVWSKVLDESLGNTAVTGFKTATFNSQTVIATTTGAITVDWTTAQNQKQTEPTGTITYTFTAPPGPCHLQLIIDSDGTSTAQTINWPGTVIWLGATYAGTNNKKSIVNFWYDGTNYYGINSTQV